LGVVGGGTGVGRTGTVRETAEILGVGRGGDGRMGDLFPDA